MQSQRDGCIMPLWPLPGGTGDAASSPLAEEMCTITDVLLGIAFAALVRPGRPAHSRASAARAGSLKCSKFDDDTVISTARHRRRASRSWPPLRCTAQAHDIRLLGSNHTRAF